MWRLKTSELPMSSQHGVLKELAQILKTLKHSGRKIIQANLHLLLCSQFECLHGVFLKANTERENVKNLTYFAVFTIRTTNNDHSVIIQQNKQIGKNRQEVYVTAKNLLNFILLIFAKFWHFYLASVVVPLTEQELGVRISLCQ